MSKNDSVVLRVKDCYVIDDCCQLMMPYLDIVTVISKDGVLFYDDKSCNKTYINKYVDDLRKDGLPYANIPTHVSSDYGVVMDYANVLLDYNKLYVSITSGYITVFKSIKDKDKAFIVSKSIYPIQRSNEDEIGLIARREVEDYNTREELFEIIGKKDYDNVFYVLDNGTYINDLIIPSNEELSEYSATRLRRTVSKVAKYIDEYDNELGNYLSDTGLIEFLKESANKDSIDNSKCALFDNHTLFVVRVKDNDINIEGFNIIFVSPDKFFIDKVTVPVNNMELCDLYKNAKVVRKTRSPKIPLELNPNIKREDIKNAKLLVKKSSK